MRFATAKLAELEGASEDQIRRAGRWNMEQMVGCYLNSLPRKFTIIMAGHPSQMGCFEIHRASITPLDELLSMIWPELDAVEIYHLFRHGLEVRSSSGAESSAEG